MYLDYVRDNPNLALAGRKHDHAPFEPAAAALDRLAGGLLDGAAATDMDAMAADVRKEIARDLLPAAKELYDARDRLTEEEETIQSYFLVAVFALVALRSMIDKEDWSAAEFAQAICTDGVTAIKDYKLNMINALSYLEDSGNDMLGDILNS